MSADRSDAGTVRGASPAADDLDSVVATRRRYVAPRLGRPQSVRELTRALTGSVGDGGGGGMMMMATG